MYILGPRDQISIPVRIDSVETVSNQFHGKPELSIRATLRLSPNAEKDINVILWAAAEEVDQIVAGDEFIPRDISLKGHCSDRSCHKAKAYLSAIWFSNERVGDGTTCIALVWHEDF